MCQHPEMPPAIVGAIRRAATKIILTEIPLVFLGWEVPPAYIMYIMYIRCIDMYIDTPWMPLGGLRGSRRDRDPIVADAGLVTLDGVGLARWHVTLTATAMGPGWPLGNHGPAGSGLGVPVVLGSALYRCPLCLGSVVWRLGSSTARADQR